jgi:hypothetical protein
MKMASVFFRPASARALCSSKINSFGQPATTSGSSTGRAADLFLLTDLGGVALRGEVLRGSWSVFVIEVEAASPER